MIKHLRYAKKVHFCGVVIQIQGVQHNHFEWSSLFFVFVTVLGFTAMYVLLSCQNRINIQVIYRFAEYQLKFT